MTDPHIRYEKPGAKLLAEVFRGVVSDEELEALRQRNAERLRQAKIALGAKWLLAVPMEKSS